MSIEETTKDIKIEFTGIPSSDYDTFCWDVDVETFIRIVGREPEEFDRSHFNDGLYKIYPNLFYGHEKKNCKNTITIEVL